jgi:phospholipid/cholesterol/gamma-HCH transport system ATP-binding protein
LRRTGDLITLIELRDVGIQFGHQQVLANINLKIETGENFVLLGPSGEGKSVLLKIMAGIIPPSTGSVLIDDVNLVTLRGKARQRILQRMGMLFQKNALFDSLTCGENIAFPLREAGEVTEKEIEKRVDYFLEAVGIPHAKGLFPDEISGGMQKRLGIARALALYPEIIFYDDPTAGLDPITSRMIVDLILQLKEKTKATLVTITNDITRAYQMADRIGMVVDKSVIITGNVEETKNCEDARVVQFIRGLLEGPLMVQD